MSLNTKISFFLLFLVILAEPHLITGHVWALPEAYAESVASLFVFIMAYGVYVMHQREMKRKEERVRRLEHEGRMSREKLIDAFEYIGVMNRRLPLLKTLTSDLLSNEKGSRQERKEVFNRLLTLAVSSVAKADWGMFRFLARDTGQTRAEFTYTARHFLLLKTSVSNKELVQTREQKKNIREVGELCVIPTSDQEMPVQGFLVFPKPADPALEDEAGVLQAIVDQAQLLHKYLYA